MLYSLQIIINKGILNFLCQKKVVDVLTFTLRSLN
jgi:hypothetical protein